MLAGGEKKAEATMEYYEVSPVSQRITWLNGQHMKMTAGLTALSCAFGYLYDSRQPQVVWQPGCSVKLDRPKVNRIKGHTSHIHPVSCPAAVTTAIQTGTYLTFYLENFNTIDQCVLELEGLWRVHKENEDDSDHKNKIWVVRVDTSATHDLEFHQPKAQDVFNDLSLLAPDFFTTRRGSKTQRLSPTKSRSRSGQHKKPPSYKINSARRRSYKRSLTPVTANRIIQEAYTQCQHNLHGTEPVDIRDSQEVYSSTHHQRQNAVDSNFNCRGPRTEGEESWSNADHGNWSKMGRTNWATHEDKSDDYENYSNDGNWSEFSGDSQSEIQNENCNGTVENGFRNHEEDISVQELQLADKTNEINGLVKEDIENYTLISKDKNCNVKVVNINRGSVNQQLEGVNGKTIHHSTSKKDSIDGNSKQRLERVSTNSPVPQAFPQKDSTQLQQTPSDRSSYKSVSAVRGIADSIRKVHESFVNSQQPQTSSQSPITPNLIHSNPSPPPETLNEIEGEDKVTKTSRTQRITEPKFTAVEEHHKRMLVDLSKHEVVGTWLYSSDEEDDDDYDDDEGIYKKEEAYFRVDVTELMHELAQADQRGHTPNSSVPNKTSAPKTASNRASLDELQAPSMTQVVSEKWVGLTDAEQNPAVEQRGHFQGEILREVQPKTVHTLDKRMHDTVNGHELSKDRGKERLSHNFESKSWSTMAKDVLQRRTQNVSNSDKNEIVLACPNRNSKNNGGHPEVQSHNDTFVQSKTQHTEAEENKENSMLTVHQANENNVNLRKRVNQFEALSCTPRNSKKILGTSPCGSLSNQRKGDVMTETRQEGTVQLERSVTNVEMKTRKPPSLYASHRSINKHKIFGVSLTQFSPSTNSNNIENERHHEQSSPVSKLRSSSSGRAPITTTSFRSDRHPSAVEMKSNEEHDEMHETEQRNCTNFILLSNDSLQLNKNEAKSKIMAEQIFNSKDEQTITFPIEKSLSSSRFIANNVATNSSIKSTRETPDDITMKPRSESLFQIFSTKHGLPQRSVSVMPSRQSQSMSSLLEPDRKETRFRQHNSESSTSLEENFERLDGSSRRSPKLKQSIFVLKKQLSKSRELRTLPGYQQNSFKMRSESELIPGTSVESENTDNGAHGLDSNSCSEIAPTSGAKLYKLQHRGDDPDFRFMSEGSTNLERENEAAVPSPKPWTEPEEKHSELRGQRSRAAEMASGAVDESVPESALVVFRLQPSAPHQAWQFKKAILKVHHRDNTRKKEDKTTLKRNAHLLRKHR